MLEDLNLAPNEEGEPATPEEIEAEKENSQKKKLPFEEALAKDEEEKLKRMGEEGEERLAA